MGDIKMASIRELNKVIGKRIIIEKIEGFFFTCAVTHPYECKIVEMIDDIARIDDHGCAKMRKADNINILKVLE
jgi:hypothetical protein